VSRSSFAIDENAPLPLPVSNPTIKMWIENLAGDLCDFDVGAAWASQAPLTLAHPAHLMSIPFRWYKFTLAAVVLFPKNADVAPAQGHVSTTP
jgi:hypothetical protein